MYIHVYMCVSVYVCACVKKGRFDNYFLRKYFGLGMAIGQFWSYKKLEEWCVVKADA